MRPHTRHKWHYITQANGLPMNPDAIAFGSGGTVYVGTQCGGLAVGTQRRGTPSNALGWNRYQWRVIKGPWHLPLAATGKGLPSNLINAVAVESGGRVVVGTDGGIAFGPSTTDATPAALAVPSPASLLAAPRRAANSLRHRMQRAPRWASKWTFEHGRNFVAKVYGLWHPPAHWTPPSGQLLEKLPTEDHTTVAAWQPNPGLGPKAGYLWLGHWRAGLNVWQYGAQGKIIQRWHIHEPQVGNYVESLQPLKGGAMAVGCYGKGAFIITLPGESKNAWRKAADGAAGATPGSLATAPEPRGARPPGVRELTAMASAIRAELLNASGKKQPRIVPLPDDWRTEGNWLGRYGKYWMCLFAAAPDHSSDIAWGFGRANMHYLAFMGPHHRRGDSIRRWVQRRFFAGDRRALQVPPPFCDLERAVYPRWHADGVVRIISELDDHGETYPNWWQGPDENVLLRIPDGLYILSIYVWNYNGHTSPTRMRDYPVAVQTFAANWRFYRAWYTATGNTGLVHSCYKRACRVIGRAEENWGGQWVRLLIRGPVIMNVRFQRNYSLNTHMLGAALDWISQKPPPYFCPVASWPQRQANALRAARMELQALRAGITPMDPAAASSTGAAGQALLSLARLQRRAAPAAWAASQAMVYATAERWLRACGAANAGGTGAMALRATCDYRLCRFRQWEANLRGQGLPVPRKLEAMTKWKGHFRVFRDGGYHQLARNAARQRIGKIMAAR